MSVFIPDVMGGYCKNKLIFILLQGFYDDLIYTIAFSYAPFMMDIG